MLKLKYFCLLMQTQAGLLLLVAYFLSTIESQVE